MQRSVCSKVEAVACELDLQRERAVLIGETMFSERPKFNRANKQNLIESDSSMQLMNLFICESL